MFNLFPKSCYVKECSLQYYVNKNLKHSKWISLEKLMLCNNYNEWIILPHIYQPWVFRKIIFKRKSQALSVEHNFNSNINKKQLCFKHAQMHIYKSNKTDCKDIHKTHHSVNYVTCAGTEKDREEYKDAMSFFKKGQWLLHLTWVIC